MTAKPAPGPDVITAAYWQRLRDGRLSFQCCNECDSAWLPAGPVCPTCWSADTSVLDSSGHGRLVTWATYRRSYHPAFSDALPYVVGLVALDEGPRLLAGVRTNDPGRLHVDEPLTVELEAREGGFLVPVFVVRSAAGPGAVVGVTRSCAADPEQGGEGAD